MLGFDIGKHRNPADTFIKVVAINYPKTEVDDALIIKLNKGYNKF